MTTNEDQLLQELRSTLSKMELSLDAIDDVIIWVDENGTIQWGNNQFSQLVNVTKIEALGKSIQKLLPLKFKDKPLDWFELINNTNKCVSSCVYEWQNGAAIKFLEITARNFHKLESEINTVIVIRDITDNHVNALIKSKLAAIVESTNDAIIGRTLEGKVESWNKAAERLYGYKADEVLGKSAILIYPENRKGEFYYTAEQVKHGKAFEITDTERIHKDGHIIPVSVMMSPIHNEEGVVIGSCSIARDITELKAMINIKDDFISTVSHELRTPLTSIDGALSLIIGGAAGDIPEDAKKLLNIAKNNTDRLIRLINDILDIQKIESGKLEFHHEPTNIGNLIQEAVLANEAYAERFNIKIKVIQKATATVNVDPDRILQVMANLISNAVKFSNADEIIISISKRENFIRVEVTNKGEGVPKEFYSRIFHKFSQAKSTSMTPKTGTGLGLSISKEIVEKHGGNIGFTSAENQATTFFFELPIYKNASQQEQYFEKIPIVLICEDDLKLANYLKTILEQNAIKAIIANTAKESKKIIAAQHVDAVLLDLTLPDEDGITLIKELKGLNANLSIIVISIIAQEGEKKLNGNAVSIIDWIEKPIDLNRLLKSIQLLKKQAMLNAPNILHVEDDVDLLQVLAKLLQYEANMFGVTTLKEAKDALDKRNYDLIILDLMLPDGSGIDLLPFISKKHIPIIVFSAYELPKNYVNYVVTSLVKSQTSSNEFIRGIKEILKRRKLEDVNS